MGDLEVTAFRRVEGRVKIRRDDMVTVLVVLLVLMLIGALPTWPYSANWGYGPTGGLGLVVLILILLILTGRI